MPPVLLGKTLLNQYHVEEFIGNTPHGELYRVTDERSGKPLALTLLSKSVTENGEIIKELEAKSGKLQSIRHKNINRYLGLFQTPTFAFQLEEWVDGPSLKDVLSKSPLSAEETLVYARSVCGALEALHQQGFLHLNLAPEFIRINQRGEIFLGGIANAHPQEKKSILHLGKYPLIYSAPEILRGDALTPAADIYSLAVILYQLVSGQWINGKAAPKSHDAIRKHHLETTPPAPILLNKSIPDHFSRMILWALRKKTEDRLKTTTELLSSLALAVQTSVDKIPLRADPAATPVTSALLATRDFLPPPQPRILRDDAIPLEERLANLAPAKKKKTGSRFIPIFFLILLGGFLSLFWVVRPAEIEIPIPTPVRVTPIVARFTPRPSVTPTPRPTLPFGGRIIFTCTRGDYNQLCLVNRDGSGYTQVTDMIASNYYPVFTPDGSSILFASNRSGSTFDLFLLNFGDKLVYQLTDGIGNVISPDYSPDGRFVVFANRVGDGPTAIWMVNADGLNPRLVYTGAKDIVSVAWSPDGEKIAYAMAMETPQEYQVYTMDVNGRNHLKISQGLQGIGGSVDWSPDGDSLLIHAGPFGDKDIFRVDAATGAFVQLTDGGNNAGASYSPNGQYIVFNSLRNNDQADLYIMRADGTNPVQLTNHPEPDWGAKWIE